MGSVTKDFMEKTGRFVLLDSDKCPKCASGKYEDIEVSLNFNPHMTVAQKNADVVVYRRFQGEGVKFF